MLQASSLRVSLYVGVGGAGLVPVSSGLVGLSQSPSGHSHAAYDRSPCLVCAVLCSFGLGGE